jgi:hypothetical protein
VNETRKDMGGSDHGLFTVLSLHFPRRLRNPSAAQLVLGPKFEHRTFQIQVRDTNYWRAMFSNGKY